MADDGAILLSPETYDRFDEAAGQVLGTGRAPRQRRLASGLTAQVYIARITNTTHDADGNYEAVITQLDPAGTWSDHGAVRVRCRSGFRSTTQLVSGQRLAVMPAGVSPLGYDLYQQVSEEYASDLDAGIVSLTTQYMGRGRKDFDSLVAGYARVEDPIAGLNANYSFTLTSDYTGAYHYGYITATRTGVISMIIGVSPDLYAAGPGVIFKTDTGAVPKLYIGAETGQTGTFAGGVFTSGLLTNGAGMSGGGTVGPASGFATTQKFGAPR